VCHGLLRIFEGNDKLRAFRAVPAGQASRERRDNKRKAETAALRPSEAKRLKIKASFRRRELKLQNLWLNAAVGVEGDDARKTEVEAWEALYRKQEKLEKGASAAWMKENHAYARRDCVQFHGTRNHWLKGVVKDDMLKRKDTHHTGAWVWANDDPIKILYHLR